MTEEAGRYKPAADYMLVTKHAHLVDRMYLSGKQKERYLRERDFIKSIMKRHTIGLKIIDVGCGTGIHIKLLNEEGYDTAGFDIRKEMVDVAIKRNPSASVIQGDMRDFPVNNLTDGILCMYGAINYLETEKDMGKTLSNFFNHLNTPGVAIIDTRYWRNLDEKIYTWNGNNWYLAKRWVKSSRAMESAYRVFYT